MSPFPKKASFPCSTPMTKAMELYNWLNEMTRYVKSNEVRLIVSNKLKNLCPRFSIVKHHISINFAEKMKRFQS